MPILDARKGTRFALGPCTPRNSGATPTRWWTGWPTICATSRSLPITPAVSPGQIRRAIPAAPPTDRRAVRRVSSSDFRELIVPGHDALESSRLVRLLPLQQQPALDPGRDADLGHRGAGHVLGDLAGGDRVGAGGDGLAAADDRPATGVRRGHSGHRLHRDAGGAAHAPASEPPAARPARRDSRGGTPLAVYASAEAHSSVDKAVKLAGYGLDASPADRDRRRTSRCVPRSWSARWRRTSAAGSARRVWSRPIGTTSSTRDRPGARDRGDLPAATACGSTWTPPTPAPRRSCPSCAGSSTAWRGPTASSSTPTSGC